MNLNDSNFTLSMKCVPEENDSNYEWEKKNSQLPLRIEGAYSSCLTILNLMPEDAGEYRCIMSNFTGKVASNYTTLSIIGKFCVLHVHVHTFINPAVI